MISKTVMRALFAGALGATLLGCPPTNPATGDSGVDAGDCSGTIGCACVNGACTAGECVGGLCTDCRRGEESCICRSNDTCNTGLRCATGRCVTCPPGELNCACGAGDTCSAGNVCASGVCVVSTCVEGTETCPCRAGDPKCDGTAYCDGTNLCRACADDVVGCPCNTGGACTGSAVCDTASMKCRAPKSCAELRTAGTCVANQACVEATNGADAVCTAGACVTGYRWNGTTCVQCTSGDCSMEPTCSTDGGADFCSMVNKACVRQGQVDSCGACLPGFTADSAGNCVAAPTCGNAGSCPLTQYCDRTVGQCLDLPCDAGMAKNLTTGSCSACPACAGEGTSGRVWPFRYQGRCICETLDNYYWPSGTENVATRCDSDNDGWVVEEADTTEIQSNDPLLQNARCNIRKVDRVRLTDEYGISVDILSCVGETKKASLMLPDGGLVNGGTVGLTADGGVVPLADGGTPCVPFPMRLLETVRNDGAMGSITTPPRYPQDTSLAGRALFPAEVNSLTKGCSGLIADFNDNDEDDIDEIQGRITSATTWAPDRARLYQFAYFMELASAYTQGNVLVVKERSRCAPDFPLRYNPAASASNPIDLYDAGVGNTYWRNCSRSRDPSFTSLTPQPGYDFAKWACDDVSGACFQPKMPHPTIANPIPAMVLMRNHGLCESRGAPPADGVWRGMGHHSQFKCVNISTTATGPRDHAPAAFEAFAHGRLTFNRCQAKACAAGSADPSCSMAQGPDGGVPQTRMPIIECQPQATAAAGSIGFAAVNYRPYKLTPGAGETSDAGVYPNNSYQGGCLNEDDNQHAEYLCPAPEFFMTKGDSDQAFGRYSCYGKLSSFLWCCDGNNQPTRSTLFWAPSPGNGVEFR